MTPQEILDYWNATRAARSKALLDNLNDGNAISTFNESVKLAAITQAVQQWVDTFKPQG